SQNFAVLTYNGRNTLREMLVALPSGRVIVAAGRFNRISGFSENRAIVRTRTASYGGTHGVINTTTGRLIAPTIYSGIQPFVNGLAIVTMQEQEDSPSYRGVIDNNGVEILPIIYSRVAFYNEMILAWQSEEEREYAWIFNNQGEELRKISYPERLQILNQSRRLAISSADGTTELLAPETGETTPIPESPVPPVAAGPSIDNIRMSAYGMAVVTVGQEESRRMGVMELETGRVIVDISKTEVRILCPDMIAVRHGGTVEWCYYYSIWDAFGGTWGIVNAEGEEIAPAVFTRAVPFVHGKAIVEYQSGVGLMNQNGEFILPLEFALIDFPRSPQNFPHSQQNYMRMRINKGGERAVPIANLGHMFGDIMGGYWGFIDRSGNIVIPAEIPFDWVDIPSPEGVARIEYNGRHGFIQIFGGYEYE
ncbi:MAG: WG repeat-containing protein, partial [Defluviitaleaceae bacterium]|nr:WG repeat-containing protein [Defluviitaleaceae bacterium]